MIKFYKISGLVLLPLIISVIFIENIFYNLFVDILYLLYIIVFIKELLRPKITDRLMLRAFTYLVKKCSIPEALTHTAGFLGKICEDANSKQLHFSGENKKGETTYKIYYTEEPELIKILNKAIEDFDND